MAERPTEANRDPLHGFFEKADITAADKGLLTASTIPSARSGWRGHLQPSALQQLLAPLKRGKGRAIAILCVATAANGEANISGNGFVTITESTAIARICHRNSRLDSSDAWVYFPSRRVINELNCWIRGPQRASRKGEELVWLLHRDRVPLFVAALVPLTRFRRPAGTRTRARTAREGRRTRARIRRRMRTGKRTRKRNKDENDNEDEDEEGDENEDEHYDVDEKKGEDQDADED